MAQPFTYGDALGIFETENTIRTDASFVYGLGGRRSGVEVLPAFRLQYPHPQLVITGISGACGEGIAYIGAQGQTANFFAPNDANGGKVGISPNQSALLESADKSKWCRVFWDGDYNSEGLGGVSVMSLIKTRNNTIAGANVETDSSAQYYITALMLVNHEADGKQIENVKVWVKEIALSAISDDGHLSSSGAGTIETTGSFAGRPASGWAHIKDSGGTTREIVYYSSRTDTVLTVPPQGRGRLGTSEAEGAATDVIHFVPGIAVALEAADSNNEIEAIADHETWPTATPNVAINATGADTVATLNTRRNVGLWIFREIPESAVAHIDHKSEIVVQFELDGETYTNGVAGYYSISTPALEQYELYVGVDAEPDYTFSPTATNSTADFTYAVTPPGSGVKEINLAVRKRNKYNLVSQNVYYRTITVDDGGEEVIQQLTPPENIQVRDLAGGYARLSASYIPHNDPTPADAWKIYLTIDGTNPVPGVSFEVVFLFSAPETRINFLTGMYDLVADSVLGYGITLKFILRTHNTDLDIESENLDIHTHLVQTSEIQPPHRVNFGAGAIAGSTRPTAFNVYTDGNVKIFNGHGVSQLFGVSASIWRVLFDAKQGAAIQTDYLFREEEQGGTGTSDLFQRVGDNIYINVGGIQQVKIDTAAGIIYAKSFQFVSSISEVVTEPIFYRSATAAYLTVYNNSTGLFVPYLKVTNAGEFICGADVIQLRS